MATADRQIKAKMGDLWENVFCQPEFKRRCMGYTLEQLARHSQRASIQRYCNYHSADIPTSEEEEEEEEKEEDMIDADSERLSESGTKLLERHHTLSEERRKSPSIPQVNPKATEQSSHSGIVRGSKASRRHHTVVHHSVSSSPRPQATKTGTANREDKNSTRKAPIGAKSHSSNTRRQRGENSTSHDLCNAPWHKHTG